MWSNLPLFPENASTIAGKVDLLFLFLVTVAGFFSVLIFTLVMFFAIRYRRRAANPTATQIHGSTALEMVWTIIPLALTMVMFGWGAVCWRPGDFVEHPCTLELRRSVIARSHGAAIGGEGRLPPSERIVLGAIGIGGRGGYVLSHFMSHPQVQVVAVCDVQAARRNAARAMAEKQYGPGCAAIDHPHDTRTTPGANDGSALAPAGVEAATATGSDAVAP